MRARPPAAVCLCLAAAVGADRAMAHESWIEPASFEIRPGRPIGVNICIADGLEGRSLARDPARVARFVAIDDAGEVPVVGLDGSNPAGAVRLSRPGSIVIAYQSERVLLEVPDAEFESFLREEGLEHVVARGVRRDANGTTEREIYSRHLKALVRVGDGADPPADRPIGMTLELIAEYGHAASAAQGIRVLHRGRPLAETLVVATRLGTADAEMHARTNADGRVEFPLLDPGLWRFATVHMTEAPRSSGAEWETFWASLTLELPVPREFSPPGGAQSRAACANRLRPTLASIGSSSSAVPAGGRF